VGGGNSAEKPSKQVQRAYRRVKLPVADLQHVCSRDCKLSTPPLRFVCCCLFSFFQTEVVPPAAHARVVVGIRPQVGANVNQGGHGGPQGLNVVTHAAHVAVKTISHLFMFFFKKKKEKENKLINEDGNYHLERGLQRDMGT
jgi:hypothetical protein